MTPQEAEKRVHEACPCRRAAQSGSTFDLSRDCTYRMEGCACAGHSPDNPCKWSGHQAARDLRKACAGVAAGVVDINAPKVALTEYGEGRKAAATAILHDDERIYKEER